MSSLPRIYLFVGSSIPLQHRVFIYGVQVADLGTIANSESYAGTVFKTFTAAEEKYYPSQQILSEAQRMQVRNNQYLFLRLVQRTNDVFIHFTAEFGAYEISTSILGFLGALFSIYYGIQAHKDRAI